MIWALLASYLSRRSPWVQAVVLGLCVGLFVATAAEANDRTPVINTILIQVLVAGALAGGFFYAGMAAQQRGGWSRDSPGPPWRSFPLCCWRPLRLRGSD